MVQVSRYRHTDLIAIKNGEKVFSLPAHLLSMICDQIDDRSIRDLEVVYIGMSYADGNRSAKERLLNHSTLQQVLADINGDAPDMEALIIMIQYVSPKSVITFDGMDKKLNIEDDRDVETDIDNLRTTITKNHQIALIEAGLIRYFQPHYNNVYKERFPHHNHKILKEIYEIDLCALTVEINTEDVSSRLFSDYRKPGYHHIANFDLHDPTTRRSFFNIFNVATGADAKDHSGPIF